MIPKKVSGKLIVGALEPLISEYDRSILEKDEGGFDNDKLYTIEEVMDLVTTTSIMGYLLMDDFVIHDTGSVELRMYRRCCTEESEYISVDISESVRLMSDIIAMLFEIGD